MHICKTMNLIYSKDRLFISGLLFFLFFGTIKASAQSSGNWTKNLPRSSFVDLGILEPDGVTSVLWSVGDVIEGPDGLIYITNEVESGEQFTFSEMQMLQSKLPVGFSFPTMEDFKALFEVVSFKKSSITIPLKGYDSKGAPEWLQGKWSKSNGDGSHNYIYIYAESLAVNYHYYDGEYTLSRGDYSYSNGVISIKGNKPYSYKPYSFRISGSLLIDLDSGDEYEQIVKGTTEEVYGVMLTSKINNNRLFIPLERQHYYKSSFYEGKLHYADPYRYFWTTTEVGRPDGPYKYDINKYNDIVKYGHKPQFAAFIYNDNFVGGVLLGGNKSAFLKVVTRAILPEVLKKQEDDRIKAEQTRIRAEQTRIREDEARRLAEIDRARRTRAKELFDGVLKDAQGFYKVGGTNYAVVIAGSELGIFEKEGLFIKKYDLRAFSSVKTYKHRIDGDLVVAELIPDGFMQAPPPYLETYSRKLAKEVLGDVTTIVVTYDLNGNYFLTTGNGYKLEKAQNESSLRKLKEYENKIKDIKNRDTNNKSERRQKSRIRWNVNVNGRRVR